MNIATPQEQFASRRRLREIFFAPPPAKPFYRNATWFADRCPWPCYVDADVRGELSRYDDGVAVVRHIVGVVAEEYSLTLTDIYSSRRTGNVVIPRQIAMYLAKVLTLRSLPQIGRDLGGKDHTTILYGVHKITKMMAESPAFASEVNSIRARLEGGN